MCNMRNTYHRVHRYKFIQIVLTIIFCWFVQTFNAQGKINPTTYKNFEAGASIIDMGIVPQTENNALKPYGLIAELVNSEIPVNWVIKPNKSFGQNDLSNKLDDYDILISGTLSSNINSQSIVNYPCKTGAFLISKEYIDQAKPILETWINNNPGLTVYWNLNALNNVPVYGVLNSFPNVVVFDNGRHTDVATGFYDRAGITSGYRMGTPQDVTDCDQFYVLSHHTDPDKLPWTIDDTNKLYDFVTNGGNIWMGCHDVSLTENKLRTSSGNNLNFLSQSGLVPYKDISTVQYPWLSQYDALDGNTDNKIKKHNNSFNHNDIY